MSRDEKIGKLGRAIREYRGKYNAQTGKWIDQPRLCKLTQIILWLDRLKLPIKESLDAIAGFKSFPEYRAWLQKIS